MEEKQEFTMKEVSNLTGLSEHTIRNWVSEFNIQIHETPGGHRRFSKDSIEMLVIAKRKKEENGWSIKQIRSFFNGDLTTEIFEDPDIQSNYEKRMKAVEETMKDLIEVNKNLTRKLDERDKNFEDILHKVLEKTVDDLNAKMENQIEKRDRTLMLELRKSQEETAATKNQKKWWQIWK